MERHDREFPDLPDELAATVRGLRNRAQGCPRPALLQAAHGGVLPAELAEPVLRHAETCLTCQTLVESIHALDAEPIEPGMQQRIRERIERERSGSRRRFLWFWPVAAAAGVLIVLAVSVMLRGRPPAAATRPTAQESKPAPVLAWEKAPIVLPPAALLVWRGKDDSGMWKELQTALLRYQSDDFHGAAELLEPLARKYPSLAEAQFYLGVCRLAGNANEGAAGSLEAARKFAQPPLADYVAWYLAMAYERTGRIREARQLLEVQCGHGGELGARACRGAQSLR
ncbi:MAG: hypothetical protein IT165_29710 [Bryobacterales bacterium]|nr:hypothetical protein [Bryobacterales bacterium]